MGACSGKSKPSLQKPENFYQVESNYHKSENNKPLEIESDQVKKKELQGDQTTSSASTGLQSGSQNIEKAVNELPDRKEPVQQVQITVVHDLPQNNQKLATNSTDMSSLAGLVGNLPSPEGNNKITRNPFKNNQFTGIESEQSNQPIIQNSQSRIISQFQNGIQTIGSDLFSNIMPSDIQKAREQGLRYANQQGELNSNCHIPDIPEVASKFI